MRLNNVLEQNDRVTVSYRIYYEHQGDGPRGVERSYNELVPAQDEPWSRRCKADEAWQPLDLGWFEEKTHGHLVIENLQGQNQSTIPSPEERADTAKRILELGIWVVSSGVCVPFATLLPGGVFAGRLKNVPRMRIRSQHDTALFRLHYFPG